MALFIESELASYMQVPSVDADTAALLIELTEGLIEDAYGSTPLPDPAPSRLKRVALEVAKRAYLNPNGYVSESLGDYSYSRGAYGRGPSQHGVFLTSAERQAVRGAAGLPTVRSVKLVTPFGSSGLVSDE